MVNVLVKGCVFYNPHQKQGNTIISLERSVSSVSAVAKFLLCCLPLLGRKQCFPHINFTLAVHLGI